MPYFTSLVWNNKALFRFFLTGLIVLAIQKPAAAEILPSGSPNPESNTATADELLKNFMAGMSYQPQAVTLPPDPEVPDLASIFPTLPIEAMQNATDANGELQEPKALQRKTKIILQTPPSLLSFMKPVLNAFISSNFGMRWGRMHEGVDLAVASGTPIHAAEQGKILYSGWAKGYGNFVAVDHGGGFSTRYGHASKLLVRKNQQVKKGQVIALVGSTGHSTGPHLHFEVLSWGRPQNPLGMLNKRIPIAMLTPQSDITAQ